MQHRYDIRMNRRRLSSGSVAERVIGFLVTAIAVVIALTVGFWLLGVALGIVVPLLLLALALAPVVFVVWLMWCLIKAVFV